MKKNEKRPQLFLLTLAFLFLFRAPGNAAFLHAPHDEAHGLSCKSCHEYSLKSEAWPPGFPPATVTPDTTLRNFICLRCHDGSVDAPGEIAAPVKSMHSSLAINGNYSDWSTECTDCHDPHFQAQLSHYADPGFFLATGSITSIDITSQSGRTIFGYTLTSSRESWPVADWPVKSGDGRGLILVPDPSSNGAVYEVIAATSSQITVQGVFVDTITPDAFGLIYGQLLRSEVKTPAGELRTVRFFDPDGGFVDTSGSQTPKGICQVCHTQTGHFRNDGSLADHNALIDCAACHDPATAFKPTGPDHGTRIAATAFCQGCHGSDPVAIHAASGCATCHQVSNNFSLVTRLQTDLAAILAWDAAKGKNMLTRLPVTCEDCHLGSNQGHAAAHDKAFITRDSCKSCHYDNVIAEHVTRRGLSCKVCHDRTGAGLAEIAAVTNAIASGRAGTAVYCETCHNDPAFSSTGSFIDSHHLTAFSLAGDCTKCHVVGRGVDAPKQAPCANCHGAGKWFDPKRAGKNAHDHGPAITNVKDYRVCFSCHLEGGQGYRPDSHAPALPATDPAYDGTPLVRPLHAKPATITPSKTNYTIETYDEAKLYPGLGSLNLFVEMRSLSNGNPQVWTDHYTRFLTPPAPFNMAPIQFDGVGYDIPSYDGTGGGGPVAGAGSLAVTITPVAAISAGARWRIDGADWRESGATVSSLNPRDYPLEATLLAGWARPDSQSVPVADGVATSVTINYLACPQNPTLAVTRSSGDGGTNISWNSASQQETFAVSGFTDGAVDCEILDAGGAAGFAVASTGGSCALFKDGPTTAGSYNLVLGATGSTCAGNSGQIALSVTVSAAGGLDPKVTASTVSDTPVANLNTFSAQDQRSKLFQVNDRIFGMAVAQSGNLVVKTYDVRPDGRMTAIDSVPVATGESSAAAFRAVLKISEGIFVISSNGTLKTVRIEADGSVVGAIEEYVFDSATAAQPALVPLAGDYYGLTYLSSGQPVIKTLLIPASGRGITSPDSWSPTTLSASISALVKVAEGIFAVCYNSQLATFTVNPADGKITKTAIDTLTFYPHTSYSPQLMRFSGNLFVLAYDTVWKNEKGFLETVVILPDGTISKPEVSTLIFENWDISFTGMTKVADDVLAVTFWPEKSPEDCTSPFTNPRCADYKGATLRTYRIAGDGLIQAQPLDNAAYTGYSLKDPAAEGKYPALLRVNGSVFLFALSGAQTTTGGGLKTLCIFNPDTQDQDHDGFCDQVDACPHDTGIDGDGDGLCGALDPCPLDAGNDADQDGICGNVDNCPSTANPTQTDSDGDKSGDACDLCSGYGAVADADQDGICDDKDNCPGAFNTSWWGDADYDGIGDTCDPCPNDILNDLDGDGVCFSVDNCPYVNNPSQSDYYHNGIGDACGNFSPCPTCIPDISVTDPVTPDNDQLITFEDRVPGAAPLRQNITIANSNTTLGLLAFGNNIGVNDPLAAPFSLVANTCANATLNPSAACTLTVQFAPTVPGSFEDTFDIPSNDPDENPVTFRVRGTGVATTPDIVVTSSLATRAPLAAVDFGTRIKSDIQTKNFYVANEGDQPLLIGSMTVSGQAFSLSANTCPIAPSTLAPGASCMFTLRFSPPADVEYAGSLVVESNDPNESSYSVSLVGAGYLPQYAFISNSRTWCPSGSCVCREDCEDNYSASPLWIFRSETGEPKPTFYSVLEMGANGTPFGVAVTLPFRTYLTLSSPNQVKVIDGSQTIAATIQLPDGSYPKGVAAAPNYVYVANYGSDTVSVINRTNNTVTATVTVGDGPVGIDLTPDHAYAYVTNQLAGTVSVIKTLDNTVTATVPVGAWPTGVAVAPDGRTVYVANYMDGPVSVIDTASNTVVKNIPVGWRPFALAFTQDGSRVYVTNSSDTSVSVIDTATMTELARISIIGFPQGIAATNDGKYMGVVANHKFHLIKIADNSVTSFDMAESGSIAFGDFFKPADNDADNVQDDWDNCPATANQDQADADGDGIGNVCDACAGPGAIADADGDGVCEDRDHCVGPGAVADADGDTICEDWDNCPGVANSDQADADGDGVGDACDICPGGDDRVDADQDGAPDFCDQCPGANDAMDTDGDTVPNCLDACPGSNDLLDPDGDGLRGCLDPCPADPNNDADGDGLCGDVDNCPTVANNSQADADGDGKGDACDACPADPNNDADGDGRCANVDNCPTAFNPGQEDANGNGAGDACDARISASPLDFGNVQIGRTVVQSVMVTNNGATDQVILSVAATTPLTPPFTITGDACSGVTLHPGASCAIAVRYLPMTAATVVDSFNILNNDPADGVLTIPVAVLGTGVPASLEAFAYVSNYMEASVSVIRVADRQVVATLPVGYGPWGATVTPDGAYVYVTNSDSSDNSVSVINAVDNTVLPNKIQVGMTPQDVVVSPDSSRVYVMNHDGDSVSVIRTIDNTVIATVPVGFHPKSMAISPDGGQVYVSCSDGLNVIQSSDLSVSVQGVVGGAVGMALSPDGNTLYASQGNSVVAVSTLDYQVIAMIPLGSGASPYAMAMIPDGSRLYVSNWSNSSVSVIDTASKTVLTTVAVENSPAGVSVTADGQYVYVANFASKSVSIIRTSDNTVEQPLTVGYYPRSIGKFISRGCADPADSDGDGQANCIDPCPADPNHEVDSDGDGLPNCIDHCPADPNNDDADGDGLCGNGDNCPTVANPGQEDINGNGVGDICDADIAVSSPLDLGRVPVGGMALLPLTVANNGGAGLAIQAVAVADPLNAPFTITDDACSGQTIPPGATCTITVRFAPTVKGTFAESFNVTSNDPDESVVTVTVQGVGVSFIESAAYVANSDSGTVSVIRVADRQVIKTLTVGGTPRSAAATPDGLAVYVANHATDNVSIIKTEDNTVLPNTIPAGDGPWAVEVSPDSSRVYVMNNNSMNVSVIRTTDNTVMATVQVGYNPRAMVVSPDGSKVYVSCSTKLYVINSSDLTVTSFTMAAAMGMEVSADGNTLYATNSATNMAMVINAANYQTIANIPVGVYPWGLTLTPDGTRLYVANYQGNTVSVIDTAARTVIDTVPVGTWPIGMDCTPDGQFVYAVNFYGHSVSVIRTSDNTVVDTVQVGYLPYSVGKFISPGLQ